MMDAAPHQTSAPAPQPAVKEARIVRGYPLVGGLVDILRDPPGYLQRVAREYPGELTGFKLGPATIYLITHPDHVQAVLQDRWRDFSKGGMWKGTHALLGNGLVSSEGDYWLRQRRMMQPLFNPGRLSALAPLMVEVIDREVTRLAALPAGTVVDMQKEMTAVTQRVILDTMFGPGIDRRETDHLGDQIAIAFEGMNLRLFLYFLPDRLPRPGEKRYRAAIAELDRAMLKLVRARRAGGGEGRDDLLSLLLHARDEGGGGAMDDRQLRDELVTLFVAGNDTTSNAMTWLWYALDKNPEIDRLFRAEVAEVLGDRLPTDADLPRLTYTRQVVQEAMRLYPPVWMFPRFAKEDQIVGGYRIPAGSPILLSQLVSHRDPTYWPNPEKFDPERFTPERVAERPRYAYYPFGGGPRQCIGNAFGLMEGQLIAAIMAQRLRPKLLPGHRVVLASASTLKSRDGMKMTLRG